jgi:hypothetical protein
MQIALWLKLKGAQIKNYSEIYIHIFQLDFQNAGFGHFWDLRFQNFLGENVPGTP